MPHPASPSNLRIRNTSARSLRVFVEPWGFDFEVRAGQWLDVEAESPAADFRLELSHDGDDRHRANADSLSVYFTGGCQAIVVRAPNGDTERFE